MNDWLRSERLRQIPDENVRALIFDHDERLTVLEADRRVRNLVISGVFACGTIVMGVVIKLL